MDFKTSSSKQSFGTNLLEKANFKAGRLMLRLVKRVIRLIAFTKH